MKAKLFLLAIILIGSTACQKKSKFPSTPEISYRGISNEVVKSGSPEDFVQISLNFTDGEGDLGYNANGQDFDIYFKDSRTSSSTGFVGLLLPAQLRDEIKKRNLDEKGISGIITFQLDASLFFILRPDRPNGDTVNFEVYIKDLAGNESNRITTDNIYILP